MELVFSYLIPLVVLIIILKIIALPFKLIKRIIINSIVGGIVLFILSYFGIVASLTWWFLALTGLFGIPGIIIGFIISAIL